MKQLTCEMCGSTELLKQEGVFVCQTCGTKYTVEEAKKMMVEVVGTVAVKNAAQLENLLNLAHSSFDSKNYAQAEEFCNQVIAMDDTNYDAWKLKGEAINYQINATNQRILEVYNCIMTSFRVLDDEQKEEKKHEVLSSLKDCFESEVYFWLNQFEAQRPTNDALTTAKNAYVDSYNKLADAFDELMLNDSKEEYLTYFDNFFINKVSAICVSAWESTVGYNYYRDYYSTYGSTWIVNNFHNIDLRKDDYRPTKNIFLTFMEETDNLIKLEEFAAEQVNDETDAETLATIYANIAFFHKRLIEAYYFKLDWGCTSTWETTRSLGWIREGSLSADAKDYRRRQIEKYENLKERVPQEIAERKKEKEEKERMERVEAYWEEHAEEKERLDKQQAELKKKIDELNSQIFDIDKKNTAKINELCKERDKKLPCEIEVDKQYDMIRDLEAQRDKCGIFKGKEKKALQARIDTEESPKLELLRKKAEAEKKAHQEKFDAEIIVIKSEGKELREEVEKLRSRIDEIVEELTKDR